MNELAAELERAVAGTPLAADFAAASAPFLERAADDPLAAALPEAARRGLARALATQPQLGGFMARRRGLLARLADAGPDTLALRAEELERRADEPAEADLELALDELRLLRREETCLAACLDLGGLASFEDSSGFLSRLAESIARRAYALARRSLASAAEVPLAVIAMGKLAGREFSYHSDLDLIFLLRGSVDAIDRASRTAQRMISYLTTMTGAGIAYAVDARLRPSGQQGALVTTFEGFERYQKGQAETWEYVAGLRARPIAGEEAAAAELLERVRARVVGRQPPPWAYLDGLRRRVEDERARESGGAIALKTGTGGLMDVDFLAGGGLLERGAGHCPALPSVPAMLRAAARGPRIEALLEDYRFLRLVEARTRWCTGRAVEELGADGALRAAVAELVEPGLGAAELVERTEAARRRVREAWRAVVEANSIGALEEDAAPGSPQASRTT